MDVEHILASGTIVVLASLSLVRVLARAWTRRRGRRGPAISA
jgi:hypothetical protein